jgi:hypothetical protein
MDMERLPFFRRHIFSNTNALYLFEYVSFRIRGQMFLNTTASWISFSKNDCFGRWQFSKRSIFEHDSFGRWRLQRKQCFENHYFEMPVFRRTNVAVCIQWLLCASRCRWIDGKILSGLYTASWDHVTKWNDSLYRKMPFAHNSTNFVMYESAHQPNI